MARLFISYARADGTAFADELLRDLDPPHTVWLDRSEIVGGAQWDVEIEQAIDGCDASVAVMTRAYANSKVSRDELQRTRRRKKPIIPLLVHGDADRQLLLESAHYIDFTNLAARPASLQQLLDLIANPAAIPRVAEAPAFNWASIAEHTGKHSRRFVQDLQGTAKSPGTFIPEVYARRETVETEVAGFLDSQATALFVVGDSGTGKTSLLCRLATDLLEQGHAVLAYDCGALADAEVGEELVRDLPVARETDARDALENIDAEGARAGKKLVILFDSIGDYRGGESNGAQVLLRRINELARRAGANVKFVLTCNAATWGRLERVAPMRLDRRAYYRSPDDEPFLRLGVFTPAELEAAYRLYQKYFELFSSFEDLPPDVRARLTDPVLLRMTAEACRGSKEHLLAVDSALGVYGRFFTERVQTPRETWLIDQLAAQMLKDQTRALALSDLSGHKDIGQEILDEDPDSTYSRMLDRGVLQESQGDAVTGPVVRFAHSRVAAYALAKHLIKQPVAETAATLVAQDARFPLAWDVARTLLLLTRDRAAFTTLAASGDVDQRELAADALVELHVDDEAVARELLQSLLENKSEAARRTALKAAYNIGPATRDFFLRAALDRNQAIRESVRNTLYLIWRNESPAGRRSVTDTLYLIWRHSPGFTYDLLTSLVDELDFKKIRHMATVFPFVIELIVTIYINHCEEEEVIQKTAALLHHLAIDRLHLNVLKTGLLGEKMERLFLGVLAAAFAAPMLKWMLFTEEGGPADGFFKLPEEERAPLGRIAGVLDPKSDLAAAYDDIAAMLESKMPTYSGSAMLAVVVHAAHDFAATEPLIRRLWDGASPRGRLWIVMGFSVLLKTTPPEWVGLLEDLTGRYVREHRDAFLGPSSRLAGHFDLVFVPLGLAYGKRGAGMPLFESLMQEALAANDTAFLARVVAALGPVGFYYPHATLDVLAPAMAQVEKSEIADVLTNTLATIRTLHFDAVDQFLSRTGAPEEFSRGIDTVADVGLVHRYILALGYFNNSVHFTLNYPRMRKPLSAGALKLLAESGSPREFLGAYTASAWRMLHASKFRVLEWTLPE